MSALTPIQSDHSGRVSSKISPRVTSFEGQVNVQRGPPSSPESPSAGTSLTPTASPQYPKRTVFLQPASPVSPNSPSPYPVRTLSLPVQESVNRSSDLGPEWESDESGESNPRHAAQAQKAYPPVDTQNEYGRKPDFPSDRVKGKYAANTVAIVIGDQDQRRLSAVSSHIHGFENVEAHPITFLATDDTPAVVPRSRSAGSSGASVSSDSDESFNTTFETLGRASVSQETLGRNTSVIDVVRQDTTGKTAMNNIWTSEATSAYALLGKLPPSATVPASNAATQPPVFTPLWREEAKAPQSFGTASVSQEMLDRNTSVIDVVRQDTTGKTAMNNIWTSEATSAYAFLGKLPPSATVPASNAATQPPVFTPLWREEAKAPQSFGTEVMNAVAVRQIPAPSTLSQIQPADTLITSAQSPPINLHQKAIEPRTTSQALSPRPPFQPPVLRQAPEPLVIEIPAIPPPQTQVLTVREAMHVATTGTAPNQIVPVAKQKEDPQPIKIKDHSPQKEPKYTTETYNIYRVTKRNRFSALCCCCGSLKKLFLGLLILCLLVNLIILDVLILRPKPPNPNAILRTLPSPDGTKPAGTPLTFPELITRFTCDEVRGMVPPAQFVAGSCGKCAGDVGAATGRVVGLCVLGEVAVANAGGNRSVTLAWMRNGDVCTWNGVKCDKDGNVQSVTLGGAALPAGLPSSIQKLIFMTDISVELQVTGTAKIATGPPAGRIAPELFQMGSLQKLNLAGGQWSVEIPESVSKATSLNSLTLSDLPNFRGPLPASLGSLALNELYVFQNRKLGQPKGL
ncbi:hypothetical protein HK104_004241 [Borealophlyctis nickersoniae]|nr:hypothetical protein HK104_004241 [Borealophlyctis nickersoniae]